MKSKWDREYIQKRYIWGGRTPAFPLHPKGSLTLEIGCGDGKILRTALDNGWDVVGLDLSLPAIRSALERTGAPGRGVCLQGDGEHLPFRESVFDIVIAVHIMAHLDTAGRRRAAAEITRVIRPGGTFYFHDYGTGDMRIQSGTPVDRTTRRSAPGILTHFFTKEEVEDLFSGLTSCEVTLHQKSLRIRGMEYPREEVWGIFKRER